MRRRIMGWLCATSIVTTLTYVHGCTPGTGGDGGRIPNDGGTTLTAQLTGDEETPPVTTSGSATGVFVLNADQTELTFEVTAIGLSGAPIASHFHNGSIGVAGSIVFDVSDSIFGDAQTTTITGSTTLSDWAITDAAAELLAGNIYFNIHTPDHPAGEIRGQLIADSE